VGVIPCGFESRPRHQAFLFVSLLKLTYKLERTLFAIRVLDIRALDSIFGMIENRESRGDRRVKIAGNTGLPRKKS